MRTQKPTEVVVTLQVPLMEPGSAADVGQQQAELKEDLRVLFRKGVFPLSHATVESVTVESAVVPAPIAAKVEPVTGEIAE